MGSKVLTVQDCIDMYEQKTGYLIIRAGKVLVVYAGKQQEYK